MSSAGVNVLLIEDELLRVPLIQQMLARSDDPVFNPVHRETLQGGLDRLHQGGIDLVLLDLSLPDSDGFGTFMRMHGAAPEMPIIVLTGRDDEALALETVKRGAQDYLVKDDVTHRWLIRSMRYALERNRAQQELKRARDELEKRVAERTADLVRANQKLQQEIAERKRAEQALLESNRQLSAALEQLRKTQQQIIQRERLHALGRMASGIAHDFNNALAPILGFSELLLIRPENLNDHEKVKSYLEMIHTSAKDSAKVVSRLREFYRYREEAETFTAVAVNKLVQQVISLTQPKWKDQSLAHGINIKINTELQDVPAVSGNETELREMLTNIIFNAVDAIPRNGTVTFRTFQRDDAVVIQIVDTGVGMAEDVRARCLEPFFSTKSDHGTGLGLGIVYGIVRRHDGDISIESAVGKGTTVSISLPMYTQNEKPPQEEPARAIPEPLRILVVEDEPLVREVISVYLQEDKHTIETAENGLDGLQKFSPGKFDIVITDRAMPEMNGDQLAAKIKEVSPRTPVILLTGFGDLMSGAGDRPAGVDLVMGKPFTLDALRESIAKGMQLYAA
jgi:signal transduction histidine kinase